MMLKSKYNFILMILILSMFLIIVGCSSDDNKSQEVNGSDQGGEFTIAYEFDISNLDPIKGGAGSDVPLLWPMYDTLISFNDEIEAQPGLAESWEFTDDKTLVLNLREGVKFHDGTEFDAEAVKINIERVNSEESTVTDLQNIEEVKIIDSATVELRLKQPDSSIELALSDRGGMMVSPTAIEEYGEDLAKNPVGAGPYKFASHDPNNELVLEAFDDYWDGEKPYLSKITAKIMVEENTRINALKSGEVDFANEISASNIEQLEKDDNLKVDKETTMAFRTIYLNASLPPVDEKAVRLAMQYGIDRKSIVDSVNFGSGEPAYQLFPNNFWAADKDFEIKYDPEKAKEILEDAGLDGVTISLIHYSSSQDEKIADSIKHQLEEVGIDIQLESMELSAAHEKMLGEKTGEALLSNWTGRPDPQMTIKSLLAKDGFYNVGGISTDELDSLISESTQTYDQEERTEIYKDIYKIALEEEAIQIPIFFKESVAPMNNKVEGFEINMLGKPIFSSVKIEEQ